MNKGPAPTISALLEAALRLYHLQVQSGEALEQLEQLMRQHPRFNGDSGYLIAEDRSVWYLGWINSGKIQVRPIDALDVRDDDVGRANRGAVDDLDF